MVKLKPWLKSVVLSLISLGLLIAPLLPAIPASAASDQPHFTQAYKTDGSLQRGMIVGLDPQSPSTVFALDSDKVNEMQGVIVAANDAPVTLSDNGTGSQAYVATLGRYPVLVSTQNGAVNAGDYITISSLAGIGMKADKSSQMVIGKAVSGFDGSNGVLSSQSLKNESGASQNVTIGQATVDLGIAHNPLKAPAGQPIKGLGWLSSAAQSVTGSEVNTTRIYAGAAVFLVTAIIVIIILYSGIRGDMIAAGRNPLAKSSIGRNLFEVVLTAVVIFIIGLGAIYLILKL